MFIYLPTQDAIHHQDDITFLGLGNPNQSVLPLLLGGGVGPINRCKTTTTTTTTTTTKFETKNLNLDYKSTPKNLNLGAFVCQPARLLQLTHAGINIRHPRATSLVGFSTKLPWSFDGWIEAIYI